jgi:hypothetical protein
VTDEMPPLSETDLADLQQRLALVDLYSRARTGETIELLVLRRGDIKVRIRQEPNHGRPHFHIEYKQEFSASYAVDTLERLAGHMPSRYERPILEWAASRRPGLEATWHQLQRGGDGLELSRSGDSEPKGARPDPRGPKGK